MELIINIFSLVGSLALFLFGMKTMSEGLEKFAGDRLRSILAAMTKNRIMGVLTGILITALIQSSSATTVMVVSFVNAGLMTLGQSIGVIMGANIGTTVTAWIISAVGFKVNIAAFAIPLLAIGMPLIFSNKGNRKSIGEFIFGFSFLFMGLAFLQEAATAMNIGDLVAGMLAHVPQDSFLTILLFVIVGALVTMIVQASAATMAITLMLFGFVRQIEMFVCHVLPMKAQDEDYRLRFISGGLLSTAELSIIEAQKEIHHFAERCQRMFGFVPELMQTEDETEFNKLFSRIGKYENITDSMEMEIASYLNKVSEGRLSDASKAQIQKMLRQITELESIGDSVYNLGRTLNRHRMHCQDAFTQEQMQHMQAMLGLVEGSLEEMMKRIDLTTPRTNITKSINIEHEINNYRKQLRNQNLHDVNAGLYSYQLGVFYVDFISECERLADYVMNVVQAGKNLNNDLEDRPRNGQG